MRIRRSLVVPIIVTAGVLAASVGVYAFASPADEEIPDATPSATVSTEPEPSDEPDPEPEDTGRQPTVDHDCGDTGENQIEVERALAVIGGYGDPFVDGEQSQEDCDAIRDFQKDMGIQPADGYAGDVTLNVVERIRDSDFMSCDDGEGLVVCVDLTHQTLWVVDDGERVLGPTVVRTGMPGYATQTGKLPITNKAETEWSVPYKVWLPYWQHFYMGQGLHQTTTYIHDMWNGSHGCVNLLPDDAVTLYEMLDVGDVLHIFGHRPGT